MTDESMEPMEEGGAQPPGGPPADEGGGGWTSWLPWVLLGVLGAIIIAALLFNQGDDEAGETTTTTVATTTTEATTTTAATTTTEPPVALDMIPLRIGAILPQTGALSAIVDALEQPLLMGVQEVNDAAGISLVALDLTDSGTDPNVASTNIDQYLTGNHDAIIGPAASGIALSVWDKVNSSQMVMCSGSSTGSIFSSPDFNPYHVRTAPSDDIQAPLLGNIIVGDGFANVAVVWRNDEYGQGFGNALADSIEAAGASVALREGYDFSQTSYTELANTIVASGADALAMIVFAEGGQIVQDLEGAGWDGQVYIADGFVDNVGADTLGGRVDLAAGYKGTYPALAPANGEPTFVERFTAFAPEGTPTIFSAHMYDCLATLVLAAQVAQSADPTVYVDEIIGVTRDGEKCTLIADCLALVWAGVDIDYDGASGPLDFSPNGEPGLGTYDVVLYDDPQDQVDEQGRPRLTYQNIDQIQGALP